MRVSEWILCLPLKYDAVPVGLIKRLFFFSLENVCVWMAKDLRMLKSNHIYTLVPIWREAWSLVAQVMKAKIKTFFFYIAGLYCIHKHICILFSFMSLNQNIPTFDLDFPTFKYMWAFCECWPVFKATQGIQVIASRSFFLTLWQ